MKKHTDGPWKMVAYEDIDRVVIENEAGSEIAEVNGADNNSVFFLPRKENARLIAAAPDLLDACKAVISNTVNPPWQLIVDAIAKAEGV